MTGATDDPSVHEQVDRFAGDQDAGPATPALWSPEEAGDDEPWDDAQDAHDGDDATDERYAAVATGGDAQDTVSPDDPEWVYASTAVIEDDVIEEPAQGTDWLDRICPYLLSDDGTSRSSQPDERHRCTAQDPPATLPLAFQERFCLTERHVRCEMYKVAEDTRSQAFADDAIPAEQVRSARFRPTVRSRPVTLEPSSAAVVDPPQGAGPDRQVLIALGAAGGFALVLLVIAVLLGGGGGGTPADLASPGTDGGPAATVEPGLTLAPQPTIGDGGVIATPVPVDTGPPILIRYELQEGERLIRIAEMFGTTRQAIDRANEEAGEQIHATPVQATPSSSRSRRP